MTVTSCRRKPNLFIIGAAKCGTTSLHDFLSGHPGVHMSEPKEPGYFVPELDFYPKEEDWYLGLFASAGDAVVLGESSTHYTKLPIHRGVPARIRSYAPEAKLIYLMRDPVRRAISHYWHSVKYFEERRPILRALVESEEYVGISDYAMQLDAYFRHFPREQLKLLVFEEMVSRPVDVLTDVLSFLGLAPVSEPALPKSNARPEEFNRIRGPGLARKFATSSLWDRLNPLFPQAFKDAWNRVLVRPVEIQEEEVRKAEEYLRPIFRDKVAALSSLLNRDFSVWGTSRADSKEVEASEG